MATWQHQLVDPPTEPRARELWLQHAAGFIIFEDVRRYAMERIDPAGQTHLLELKIIVGASVDLVKASTERFP